MKAESGKILVFMGIIDRIWSIYAYLAPNPASLLFRQYFGVDTLARY
jgi:hypothetical protein